MINTRFVLFTEVKVVQDQEPFSSNGVLFESVIILSSIGMEHKSALS